MFPTHSVEGSSPSKIFIVKMLILLMQVLCHTIKWQLSKLLTAIMERGAEAPSAHPFRGFNIGVMS